MIEEPKEYLCKYCGLKGAMEKGGFCCSECFEAHQFLIKNNKKRCKRSVKEGWKVICTEIRSENCYKECFPSRCPYKQLPGESAPYPFKKRE